MSDPYRPNGRLLTSGNTCRCRMGGQRPLEPVVFVTLHLQDGNWSHTRAVSHKCDPPRPRQFSRSQRLAENEDDSLIVEPSLRITLSVIC
jgi:hypothetical protein